MISPDSLQVCSYGVLENVGLVAYTTFAIVLRDWTFKSIYNNLTVSEWVSEWVSFNATSAIFSSIMARTSYFQWDDDEVRFVLDQHVELETTIRG